MAAQALVAAGLGFAVIPGLAVTHPVSGVEVRAMLESLTHAAQALSAGATSAAIRSS